MLKNLTVSFRQSREILASFKPDIVIGTGGYVCYPVLKEAEKIGIKTLMHESNAVPGLTSKMLSGKVTKMLTAFPNTEHEYKDPERVIFTGTPIRGSFSEKTRADARFALGLDSRPLVVSFWGSLGASKMNDYIAEFISFNDRSRTFNHIHATGGGDAGVEKLNKKLDSLGVVVPARSTDIRPYIENMGTVMTAADIILCRSGASTLAELTALGRACILVPSPNVTNHHQEKNAAAVEKAGGAVVLNEEGLTGRILYETVTELLSQPTALRDMESSCASLGSSDAAERIVDIALSLVH